MKALEVIALGWHTDDLSEEFQESVWAGKVKTEARGLLEKITTFSWTVSFLTVYHLGSHLEPVTVKFQLSSLDILHAYKLVIQHYIKIRI